MLPGSLGENYFRVRVLCMNSFSVDQGRFPQSVIRGQFPHRQYSRTVIYNNGCAGTVPGLQTALLRVYNDFFRGGKISYPLISAGGGIKLHLYEVFNAAIINI